MASEEDYQVDLCTGCHRVVSLESPGVIICPDCLIGRYCSEDCARDGRAKHKVKCRQLALLKLDMVTEATLNLGKSRGAGAQGIVAQTVGWFEAISHSLCGKGVLPDCCTEKQLDELSVLWPRVYSMISIDPGMAYMILTLAIRYAMLFPRPAATVQRLIHDSCELVKTIPPASEEDGAKMWGTDYVYTLCMSVGELLANVGRPREAVEFIQSVKPNLEVALLLQKGPRGNGAEGPLDNFVLLYRSYAWWLKQCIPEKLTRAEYRAHPDRQKKIESLKQAIKLSKGAKERVAWCAYDLGMEYLYVEDVDLALQVFQKTLKLPWNKRSAEIAIKAVECHILAGRDTQAGNWIDQLLRLEEHCPGRLNFKEQALLHYLRALLYRRRGDPKEALSIYGKERQLLVQFKPAGTDHERERNEAGTQGMLDTSDCLDALGQTHLVARALQHVSAKGVRRPLEELSIMQGLLDKKEEAEALFMFEPFTDQMVREWGSQYWRWRLKGVTLWGMEMLSKWEGLVMQLLPEGERRAAVLARIEEMRGLEATMKQKLLDDRRAQAIVEVREQVTGKPASGGEGILEGAGEATADGEGILALTAEPGGDRKPSKAARKKRKKRQKKAAQAQHDSSQQGAEAGLEQSMAGLSVGQEDEASEDEGPAGVMEKQSGNVAVKEECAICLNELVGDEGEEGLACGHVMHASCLRCWARKCASLSIDTTCPVCRTPLVES